MVSVKVFVHLNASPIQKTPHSPVNSVVNSPVFWVCSGRRDCLSSQGGGFLVRLHTTHAKKLEFSFSYRNPFLIIHRTVIFTSKKEDRSPIREKWPRAGSFPADWILSTVALFNSVLRANEEEEE